MTNTAIAERLARLEEAQKNAAENAAAQRRDMIERIDRSSEHLSEQIEGLKHMLVDHVKAAADATAKASEAASTANVAIADFTSKLKGARLLVTAALAAAGATGGVVVKLLAWWQSNITPH